MQEVQSISQLQPLIELGVREREASTIDTKDCCLVEDNSCPYNMATGSDTPEHGIFQKNLYNISKGILPELVEFASKAVERSLLAPDKLDEILKSSKTIETALKLAVILLHRIEQNSSEFYEILEILQSMPTLAPVVNMLQIQSDHVSSHIHVQLY